MALLFFIVSVPVFVVGCIAAVAFYLDLCFSYIWHLDYMTDKVVYGSHKKQINNVILKKERTPSMKVADQCQSDFLRHQHICLSRCLQLTY